ncbi:hypothetical protein L9F63_010960, partial [Diploptera punctata]
LTGDDTTCGGTLHEQLKLKSRREPMTSIMFSNRRIGQLLTRCLNFLDISSNRLTSIADIEHMHELKHLRARKNCISNMNDITNTMKQWLHLTEMELQGNPICSQQKYRERIITNSVSLVLLDGKEINNTTRDFLRQIEMSKTGHQRTPFLVHNVPKLSPEIANLTKNFTSGVRKSITQSILQDAEFESNSSNTFTKSDESFFSPPWKA